METGKRELLKPVNDNINIRKMITETTYFVLQEGRVGTDKLDTSQKYQGCVYKAQILKSCCISVCSQSTARH